MAFDVVSAVVARPFACGGLSSDVIRAWSQVAAQHEEEIAARMLAAASSEGQQGRVPVSSPSGGHGACKRKGSVKRGSLISNILSVLVSRAGGASVGEIAHELGVAKVAKVSVATKDMQFRGLVKRGSGQGAGVFVMVTDKGRAVLADCDRLEGIQ